LVDQLKRSIPLKWDLGSIITLVTVMVGMVWFFGHSDAKLEQTNLSVQQTNRALEQIRLEEGQRIQALEQKLDTIRDKQAEAAVSSAKVQADVQNLHERLAAPPPTPPRP
jgi:hypothetical protein